MFYFILFIIIAFIGAGIASEFKNRIISFCGMLITGVASYNLSIFIVLDLWLWEFF